MILQKDDKSGWNAWQAFLVAQGYTDLQCDGIPGPKTLAATRDWQAANGLRADGIVGDGTIAAAKAKGFGGLDCGQTDTPLIAMPDKPVANGTLDPHSEALLLQVIPALAEKVRDEVIPAINAKLPAGYSGRVISGYRSYDAQNKIWQQGRNGHPGPVVTKARGGYSNHNFGLAVDIGIFDANGKYLKDSPLYDLIQPAAHAADLESGADWHHINDRPHIQIKTDLIVNGMPTNACRALYAHGGLSEVWSHSS